MDIDRLRDDTPGTRTVVHFNNAGAALPPRQVTDRVIRHLEREAAIGGYEAAAEAAEDMAGVYASIAGLIGAGRDEIALVDNATRAWDLAFASLPLTAGDRVLASHTEYASNMLAMLHMARRRGVVIDIVPPGRDGTIDTAALEDRIDGDVKLVALTHVPTGSGLVQPAAAVGAVARRAGVPFLLDACQSVGQMPVDVGRIGCDMLAATGRKYLRGPRGTGFLYVSRQLSARMEPPFPDLHSATWTGPDSFTLADGARRFETFETNVAGFLGLGGAVRYALDLGLDAIADRVRMLAGRLRDGLADVAGVTMRDPGAERCGIVTFDMVNVPAADIKAALGERRINVSVSPFQSNVVDFGERGLGDVVRASVHCYNTEAEVDRFLDTLAGIRRR